MISPQTEGSVLFSSLPKWRAPWHELVLSYGIQAVVIAILVWIPVLHPEILEPPKKDYHAIELVPTPVPVNHNPQRQLPKPVLQAKLDPPPAALRLPAPQPQPKPRVVDEAPVPEVKLAATKKLDPIPTTRSGHAKAGCKDQRLFLWELGSANHRPRSRQGPDGRIWRSQWRSSQDDADARRQHRAIGRIRYADRPWKRQRDWRGERGARCRREHRIRRWRSNGHSPTLHPLARCVKSGFGDADVPAPPTVQSRPAAQAAARMVPAEILSKPVPSYTEEARNRRLKARFFSKLFLKRPANCAC